MEPSIMEPRRLIGPTFTVRPNGCVEMPAWAAEIMYVFMVYMPYSWRDIVVRLKALEPFTASLDEYKLIYSFCMALNARDPVLLNLVSYDTAAERYVLPPNIQAIYHGGSNPLSFWAHSNGQGLRNMVSALMGSGRAEFRLFSEFSASRRDWKDFCRQVDLFSSRTRSTIDWVVLQGGQRASHLSGVLLNAYTPSRSILGQELGTTALDLNESRAVASSLLLNLREIRVNAIPSMGQNFRISDAARDQARSKYEAERKGHVTKIIRTWVVSYPGGAEETCCICLEDIAVPSIAVSTVAVPGTAPNFNPEVPVRTPCKHYFGFECLSVWLLDRENCPLCRGPLLERNAKEEQLLADALRANAANRRLRSTVMTNSRRHPYSPEVDIAMQIMSGRNSLP